MQCHGTHWNPAEPPGACVPGLIVGRHGRPGQDELPWFSAFVHGAADAVPDPRDHLPFVQQSGCRPIEDERGVQLRGATGIDVDVEEHGAGSALPGGRGLADSLGSLNHDGTEGGESGSQLVVHHSGAVVHAGSSRS